MLFIDILAPLLTLIPIGIYLYFIIARMFSCFITKKKKWLIILITLMAILPAFNVWGLWFLILIHLTIINLFIELGNLIYKKLSKGNRRKWWIYTYNSFALPLLVTALLFGYGAWNIRNVHQTNYSVITQKDIRDKGYKIALISDLHFENVINSSTIDSYISKISNENPDIVILAGDIVDEYTSHDGMKKVFQSLSKIKNRFGIFFVYGNHDYDNYGMLHFDEQELRDTITNAGIQILEDTNVMINNDIVLIGRKDYSVKNRLSSNELYNKVDKTKFSVLIDHQPVEIQKNIRAGFDLQLSGHTHGGQIFPSGILGEMLGFTEMNYGYNKIDNYNVIVSSGMVGWGYPIRTEGVSEYVIIDLELEK